MGRRSAFTQEEKQAAVKLSQESGRSIMSVASEYGVHPNTLGKWRKKGHTNSSASTPTKEHEVNGEAEVQRMKRRIAELEAENEFLKKVSAYFAKDSR